MRYLSPEIVVHRMWWNAHLVAIFVNHITIYCFPFVDARCDVWQECHVSSEGYFRKDEDEYQKIGRLRDCFANIPNINRLDFITDQNKSLKLSVHPALITLDLNRLLTHKDPVIEKLSENLVSYLQTAAGHSGLTFPLDLVTL